MQICDSRLSLRSSRTGKVRDRAAIDDLIYLYLFSAHSRHLPRLGEAARNHLDPFDFVRS